MGRSLQASPMVSTRPIIELRGISKSFGGVNALRQVDLSLGPGETVALVGENGAGKSTLLKVLGGLLHPDEGTILVDGKARPIDDVPAADELGIRLIHQELNLAQDLTVAENLFLGRQPFRGPRWCQVTDARSMHQQASEILRQVGLNVSTWTIVRRLSVAQQQLVEIGKALSTDARILVLDEPTSSLSLDDSNRLLNLLEKLRSEGTTILYVSHRLPEVVRLADRAVVLRDGANVGDLVGDEINEASLVSLMVGRDLSHMHAKPRRASVQSDVVLQVKDFCYRGGAAPVSMSIRAGEIVGVAGLVGAGRTELARALFGVAQAYSGTIKVHGETVAKNDPRGAMNAGMAFVPEDRKQFGLLLEMAIAFNITLAILPRLARFGWYARRSAEGVANSFQTKLRIASPDRNRRAALLSGGNQQKVVLAKWLATQPRVLILDEPTRGVDVGAKREIYQLIWQLADQGMAVMMVSSDMEEVIGISDRVLVMHEGKMMGDLVGSEINESSIMELAVGGVN
jgi:ribose transport system ATP-binding protein